VCSKALHELVSSAPKKGKQRLIFFIEDLGMNVKRQANL
jgi:hypothetical protein